MTDHTDQIKQALLHIAALGSVTRGHPDAQAALPCAEVRQLSARPLRRYDDGAYLTTYEYGISLYGQSDAALDTIAGDIEQALGALGMTCALRCALPPDGDVKQRSLRFRLDE